MQRLKQKGEFSVAAFNSEGSRLATVGHAEGIATGTTENGFRANTELKVWDLSSGTALTTKSFGTTSAIEFSPDSRHIILNEVDFTDPDVQSDLVVIDAVTANEVLRMRRIGYSPKFGFLANDTIFATVLSRNIDGVQMHVLGRLFSWQLPDAMRDLPSEMHKTRGEM